MSLLLFAASSSSFPADELTIKIEIRFDGATWVDVSANMIDNQTVSISRGRSNEASSSAPASVSFTLDNPDGDYTPGLVGGTHWPNVKRGVECRITVATDKVRFFGTVASWAPYWPAGGVIDEARVAVTASGVLRRLRRSGRPKYALNRYCAGSPATVAYWPLDDTTYPLDSPMDDVASGSTGAALADPDSAFSVATRDLMRFTEDGQVLNLPVPAVPAPSSRWDLVFVMRLGSSAGPQDLLDFGAGGTITVLFGGGLDFVVGDLASNAEIVIDTPGDEWVIVSVSAVQNGADVDYTFSWQSILNPDTGDSDTDTRTGYTLTGFSALNRQDIAAIESAGLGLGHVTVLYDDDGSFYAGMPSATLAFAGEEAAARIERLCGEEDVAVEIDAIGPSPTMGPQVENSLLPLLEEAAAVDQGILADRRDAAGLLYRPAATLYNQTATVFDASADEIINPFQPVLDDQQFRNDITVTRTEGGEFRATDYSAGDEVYEASETVNVPTDDDLPPQAGWRLHLGTWPGMRYPGATIDLGVAPSRIAAVAALELGDRIQVTDLPDEHPGDADLLVQGYTETLGPDQWTWAPNSSPAGPWTVGELGSATLGRADTAGSELNGAITDSATSISVATTTGPVWVDTTSHASEFPFDIEIGGETMTVTAITGTSSPQTFTVTRSVNGVVKSHADGAAVALAQPMIVAL